MNNILMGGRLYRDDGQYYTIWVKLPCDDFERAAIMSRMMNTLATIWGFKWIPEEFNQGLGTSSNQICLNLALGNKPLSEIIEGNADTVESFKKWLDPK